MPRFSPSRKNMPDLPTALAIVIVIDELGKIKDKWNKKAMLMMKVRLLASYQKIFIRFLLHIIKINKIDFFRYYTRRQSNTCRFR